MLKRLNNDYYPEKTISSILHKLILIMFGEIYYKSF